MPVDIDPIVQQIAARYGVPLSPRSCTGGWMWDGRTLATCWQEYDHEAEDAAYLNASAKRKKELFGKLFLKPDLLVVEPDMLLHDIGHWLATPEWLRDLPEFGLDPVLDGEKYLANGGWNLLSEKEQERYYTSGQRGVVDQADQDDNESFAYLFGLTMCRTYGIDLGPATYIGWLEHYQKDFVAYEEVLSPGLWRRNRRHVVPAVLACLNDKEAAVLRELVCWKE